MDPFNISALDLVMKIAKLGIAGVNKRYTQVGFSLEFNIVLYLKLKIFVRTHE